MKRSLHWPFVVLLVCVCFCSRVTADTGGWKARWEQNIVAEARTRYCDKETGEEIGWLVSPFLDGFCQGYLLTGDTAWLDRFVDWSDSWIRRGVKEPDGYLGWPKEDGASTGAVPGLYTDNMLGDAMGLTSAVKLCGAVRRRPELKAKYGAKFESYLALSEQMYRKWSDRGCWREVKDGGVWVVPTFGIDKATGKWTAEYAKRGIDGFTLPDNKQNIIACWMLAMYDVTQTGQYKERAEKWFRVMKARMTLRDSGRYFVWNYWEPGGPWDNKPGGGLKHWVGVHPNGGYYEVDTRGIVEAYHHHLVFTRQDIDRLVSTNRDYMWNQLTAGAAFKRIDGGEPADPWRKTPGVLWTALVEFDSRLREVFEANHRPESWGGLERTPWYLAQLSGTKR